MVTSSSHIGPYESCKADIHEVCNHVEQLIILSRARDNAFESHRPEFARVVVRAMYHITKDHNRKFHGEVSNG